MWHLLTLTTGEIMIGWLCIAIMAAPFVFEYQTRQLLKKLGAWWRRIRPPR